jgi:hypothetical protein
MLKMSKQTPRPGGIYKQRKVEIVSDPDTDGGFPVGARFSTEETRLMLSLRHFTLGTVVKKGGKEFIVSEGTNRQKLCEVKNVS